MAKDDPLDKILEQLRAAVPEFPVDKLEAAALRIRQDLGGYRGYIRKAPSLGKARGLERARDAGASLSQAFESIGVSRSRGYELLRRPWIRRYR